MNRGPGSYSETLLFKHDDICPKPKQKAMESGVFNQDALHGFTGYIVREQISVQLESKFNNFHTKECIWKYRLENGGHFVLVAIG